VNLPSDEEYYAYNVDIADPQGFTAATKSPEKTK
jgi:hypothetical protein